MRITIKICLLIVGMSLFYGSVKAYDIKKIGIKDGLSNNNVMSVTQDNDGMLWIATKDGLNRYDGHSFKVFRKNGDNSPASNIFNVVLADKKDNVIWIATEKNGLDAYNYRTNEFTHYTHDYSGQKNSIAADGITDITCDSIGNLWLATYQFGLDYFDKKTGVFTHYNQSNIKGLPSNYNWCVMYESDESVYVGHVSDGMSIINLKTKTAVNFKHDADNPNSLPDNTVTNIFKDSKGNIWVGTRSGLVLFDPLTNSMTVFKHDAQRKGSISHNFIQSIIETKDSVLWVGTEGGGVNIVDIKQFEEPKDIQFESIGSSDTEDGLSSLSVQTIFQDAHGNMWLGGFVGGINLIPVKEPFFKKLSFLPIIGNTNSLNNQIVFGFTEGSQSDMWIANGDGGVCVYNGKEKIRDITSVNNKPLMAQSIFKDSNNDFWIGTVNGNIYKFEPDHNRFSNLNSFPQIKNVPIYNFYEDSNKNLWISTDLGLLKYNIKTEEHFVYTTQNSALTDNIIRSVVEDANGDLWVGTAVGGLCVFDTHFQLRYNFGQQYDFYNVNHLYRDTKDRIWVGSQNDLFYFEDYTLTKRIGLEDGMAETDVRAIAEGNSDHEIWFSTLNGISHYNIQSNQIVNFNMGDGISTGDYINGVSYKSVEGTIYFGTQNGATFFNQNLDLGYSDLPNVMVTSFEVPSKANETFTEFVDFPFNDNVNLNYNENSFRISFNVADFSLTDKVDYMFQMVGLDNNWYLMKEENTVTFRNLNPGSYQFNLKVRLHNKEWTDEIKMMSISIEPPYWQTWQAKILYLVLFVLGSWFILRFYKNKVDVENALVLEKSIRQREHDLNEEKIKFFTNIAHELRTPMTLLIGPLEDLVAEQSFSESLTKKINSMHRVANRLLQLINQVLEFRRTESKKRELAVVKGDLGQFIYETGLKYKELNQNKKVEFEIELPKENKEILYDPEVVGIILDNLLSNAFKYTLEGCVCMKMKQFEEFNIAYTEIEVSDTGYGISEDNLTNIFERYYQAKDTKHAISGTGIGLALVKNLVELHQAEIYVKSELDKGTTFTVRFLTNNSYPGVKLLTTHTEQLEDEEVLGNKDVILVVDDNQDITEYIYDSLSEVYQVYTANNGLKGYEVACEKVPDIIISDIMMPVMDGIEMCKKMKQDIRTSHIPVILLTAKDTLQDKSEGYDAGADSYLTKPFSSSLLKSRLRNILETRKKLSDSYTNKIEDKQKLFKEATNKLDKDFLEKLDMIIEENLEDEEMNISQIAQYMNMSHSTLYRKIKALTDMTANEYIRKIRMRVAEQLILSGKYTISEVMYRIGINSTGYFRQCFKDEFGISPSDYLKKLKE